MSKHDHEAAASSPDLLLTTARTLRDYLGSVGKGGHAEELTAALKPHEDAAKEKADAEKAKADAEQKKADDKEMRKSHG